MAQYTGYQSILNEALGGYRDKGFTLTEPDDHILELRHNGVVVARFNQSRATFLSIREACMNYLVEQARSAELGNHAN